MTYTAKLRVHFDTEWTSNGYGVYDDETLPEEHYTFEIPVEDINTIQLFRFFGTIARTMGHNEIGIMKGATSLAFNDMRSEDDMRKIADEFDMKLEEDYRDEVCKLEDEVSKLEAEVRDLKAKLSRALNPDAEQYTDAEIEAMTAEEYGAWKGLVPGSSDAIRKGCKCPVMDNEEMPDDKKWVNGDCPLHGKVL